MKCQPEGILPTELESFPQFWFRFLWSNSLHFEPPRSRGSMTCMAIGAPDRLGWAIYSTWLSKFNVWLCSNQVTRKLVYTCGVAMPEQAVLWLRHPVGLV